MNINVENNKRATRPFGIYVFCLWSIARAYAIVYDLQGDYLYHRAMQELYGFLPKTDHPSVMQFLLFLRNLGAAEILPFVCALAFVALCIPLLMGKAWSRIGYLLLSAIMVILQFKNVGIWYGFSYPLYSLAVLGISYWYLRQPEILKYFRIEAHIPRWLEFKLLNLPLDFALSFSLLILMIYQDLVAVISQLILAWAIGF